MHDTEALRLHLGLPKEPIFITEVTVPKGTEMYVGRIGPQPEFGLMEESGFQYQLSSISQLSRDMFSNTMPISDFIKSNSFSINFGV